MAFATLHFHSPTLLKACSMNVIFPSAVSARAPFPVFYLLHGLSDDHTAGPVARVSSATSPICR